MSGARTILQLGWSVCATPDCSADCQSADMCRVGGHMCAEDGLGSESRLTGFSTIGAGDTFIAGMLYGLIHHAEDWDTATQLRFAVDLATEKIQRDGFARLGSDLGRGSSRSC
jgi:hypothetical protein